MMRRLSILLAMCLAPLINVNAANSAETTFAYSPNRLMNQLTAKDDLNGVDKIGFVVSGESVFPTTTSLAVQPPGVKEGEVRGKWIPCESTNDPNCNFADAGYNGESGKWGITGWSILPVCDAGRTVHCIEDLEISYDDGEFSSAQYEKALTAPSIPADPSLNYIGGGSATLWNDSSVANSKKVKYMVNVGYGNAYDPARKTFDFTEMNVAIRPFVEVSGDYKAPYWYVAPNGEKWLAGANIVNGADVWFDNGKAGVLVDFPAKSKFRVKVRATNTLSGWYKGRLKNPNVNISPISNTNNLISIEGEPVSVPTFLHVKDRADLTSKEDLWRMNNGGSGRITNATAYQGDIFEYLDYFRPLVNDKASGVNTFWSLNSTNWGNESPCLIDSKRVVGIVTTNAMGYSGSSPRYENGTLNYQVAGMHYLPDGTTLVEGTYDLLMRSDAARCLYGFSNAPIQASISITGEQTQKVAVTSMTESNGWIKLSAYGFNFSSPTIKVKFTQEKSAAAAVKLVPKKSITCVKGKSSKKISGTNPKCPTGFRIKK